MIHKKVSAIFLDRDGVINRLITKRGPRETPQTPAELVLMPKVKEAIKQLRRTYALLIIITNQPNIAKGKTTWRANAMIEKKLHLLLSPEAVDAVYTCFHHPDPSQVKIFSLLKACDCRKPKPGLLLQAAKDYSIDLTNSIMIGDNASDIAAGQSAGCRTVLIGVRNIDAQQQQSSVIPDARVPNLLSAVPVVFKYLPHR